MKPYPTLETPTAFLSRKPAVLIETVINAVTFAKNATNLQPTMISTYLAGKK